MDRSMLRPFNRPFWSLFETIEGKFSVCLYTMWIWKSAGKKEPLFPARHACCHVGHGDWMASLRLQQSRDQTRENFGRWKHCKCQWQYQMNKGTSEGKCMNWDMQTLNLHWYSTWLHIESSNRHPSSSAPLPWGLKNICQWLPQNLKI